MAANGRMKCRSYRHYVESALLPKKCTEIGADELKVREVFAVVEPIATEAENADPGMKNDLYRNWHEFRRQRFPNVLTWNKIVTGAIDSVSMETGEKETLFMVSYAVIVESVHEFVMNWLCCALVAADGTQTFVGRNKNWKSVSKNKLGRKLSFLKTNGLDQFVDALDFNIRHAFAHMSFRTEQGMVRIRETDDDGIPVPDTERVIDIDAKYRELRDGLLVWYRAIDHFYDLNHEPYRHFSASSFETDDGIAMVEKEASRMTGVDQSRWPAMARAAEARHQQTVG